MSILPARKKQTVIDDIDQADLDSFAKENGHPPSADKIICLDFDGTIRPWGGLLEFPPPFDGIKEWVALLRDRGYKVILFTSRLSAFWHEAEGRDVASGIAEQVEYLRLYCEKYSIEVDGATAEKIPAVAYLDDKAIRFNGDWSEVIGLFSRYVEGDK